MKNYSNTRIGFFARADNGGLGCESWEFCRHIKPDKVLVIRGEHGHYPERFSDFNCQYTDGIPTHNDLDIFLKDIDVVFSIETFYNWGAIIMAKERNIKTVLRINYELNILQTESSFPHPDLFLVPSQWYYDQIPFKNKKLMLFPVNREVLPFKKRNKIESFYYIAGHNCYEDRNGKEILFNALPSINAPVKILSQHDLGRDLSNYPNVEVIIKDYENYWEIHQGDCLILPRRYGGQCLPMNEALSCGISVLMPNISPQSEILPSDMLYDSGSSRIISTQGGIINCFDQNPQTLASTINELYTKDITELSEWANIYADTISWKTLKPYYLDIFNTIVYG